ncbi:MAG: UrcA family protein [Cyclobacteriaceae bacterium]|jgi:UrcA family protein
MKNRTAIVAFLLTATMTTGAMASTVEINNHGHKSVTIDYTDLNITNEAGAKILSKRIETAASKVCGIATGAVPIGVLREQRNCVNGTIAATVKRIDNDQFELLHQS